MPSQPATSRGGHRPDASDVLAAACALVSEAGLAGLTLRPLAQRLGVSVSVLSNHFGARSEIIAAIVEAAIVEDALALAPWTQRVAALSPLEPLIAADLAEAALEELTVRGRGRSLLFTELVQAGAWDSEVRAPAARWASERARFWTLLGAGAGLPEGLLEIGFLPGYILDELVFSLVLADSGPYRLLRRLCLRRLFSGIVPIGDATTETRLFDVLFEALEDPAAPLGVDHAAPTPSDWRGRAALASAELITSRGVGAVTHRAVAAAAEVAPATLGYRYPTQETLVVAGLEYIISHMLGALRASDYEATFIPPSLDIGRATFAVAIAAARMTRLAPCTADMRRRRGINLRRVLEKLALPGLAMDALAAQVLAIGFIGLSNGPADPDEDKPAIEPFLPAIVDWAAQVGSSSRKGVRQG